MPLLTVLALMALPFLEVWLMIVLGGWIGVPWTLAALVASMILGVAVLRRSGRAFREVIQEVDDALLTGRQPRKGLMDPLMFMAGGVLMVIPGFLTAALGLLLVTPLTRPALRWVFTGWARRRVDKAQERVNEEFAAHGATIPGGASFGHAGRDTEQDRPVQGRVIQGHFEPDDKD